MIFTKSDIEEIRQNFFDNGVAILKNFCIGNRLNLVEEAIKFTIRNPSPFAKKINNKKGEFFYDFFTYKRNESLRKLLSDITFINTIKSIVDTKKLNFFHDHILVKKPSAPSTPWHQDRPYYFVNGPKNFSIWITPDNILEENSLAFCSGSHKSGNEYIPIDFSSSENIGNHTSLKILDDEAINSETSKGVIIYRMKPGDAILFNNKTIHKSLPSANDKERSALSLRFVGDNAKLTGVCTNPTPPFHRLGMKIKEGASIDTKWFPNLPLQIE